MAKQAIIWTVLPWGRVDGRWRVSVVVSPRLTPEAADEQVLKAFPEWLDWPKALASVRFGLRIGAQTVGLRPMMQPDSALWTTLFADTTPVAGFVFKDMSKVNLRSFAVRNVLGMLRKHYASLAVQSAGTHPTLLPWKDAHPELKGMLTELGTRTQKISLGDRQIEVPLPGFDRFLDDANREGLEQRLRQMVFGPKSNYRLPTVGIGADDAGQPVQGPQFPIRVLPPDWSNPAGGGPDAPLMSQFASAGEYTLYQANRFYRREPPSAKQLAMRRPDLANVPAPPKAPEYDFHRILASYADYPALLRALGLVIDCVLEDGRPIESLLANAPEARGFMGLELKWSNGHKPDDDRCPRTAWLADAARFVTRPRTAAYRGSRARPAATRERRRSPRH